MDSLPTFTKTFHRTSYPAIEESNPSLSATGKVVVVTGGGRGIGKPIAISFAKAGAKAVVILGRTEATLLQAKEEIQKAAATATGGRSHPILVQSFVADTLDAEAVNAAFASVRSQIGPIDVLVNNAGYLSEPASAAASSLDDYWYGFEVNVRGALIVMRAFLKGAAAETATLINMATAGTYLPVQSLPGFSGYSASKLAMTRVMEFVQQEQPSLRVFNLHPGMIETDMSRKTGMTVAGGAVMDDVGLPAAFCVWLASRESDFVKGRFVWANWDVEELKQMEQAIKEKNLLTMGLIGWG
ncbi:hypothetical protein MMC18_000022 [Xylographa bjoerkii]|nr:hypothetical protein [Xylographa bjoerkii]